MSATFYNIGGSYYAFTEHTTNPGDSKQKTYFLRLKSKSRIRSLQQGGACPKDIPHLSGFTVHPSHTDYQRIVNNYFNLYNPISHVPQLGDWSAIDSFLIELAPYDRDDLINYLRELYCNPTKRQPVLVLKSNERQTGRTTFCILVEAIFESNAISIGDDDLRGDYNDDFAAKLVLMLDGVSEISKSLLPVKRLSTATEIVMRRKYYPCQSIPFFAKFILCSNTDPRTDPDENRISTIITRPIKHPSPNYMREMKAQIPAFLWFLQYGGGSTRDY